MRFPLVLTGWTSLPKIPTALSEVTVGTTLQTISDSDQTMPPEGLQALDRLLQRAFNPLTLFESDQTLQGRLAEMLARPASANRVQEAHPNMSPHKMHAAGEYPIVPFGKPPESENDSDIPRPLTLQEVQNLLVKLRKQLTKITNVKARLSMKYYGEPGKLSEQLMAIPFKNTLSKADQNSHDWHKALEITAAILHLIGRRLVEEREYQSAMEYFTQAMIHYSALDASAYVGWIDGICADMDKVPTETKSQLSVHHRKALTIWNLQETFNAYRNEFMSESGRYVFMPPMYSSEPIVKSVELPARQTYQPEEGVLISKQFEVFWKKMSWGQRFLLGRPLNRIRASGNYSAAGLLDTIAWHASRKQWDAAFVNRWITKAIYALDSVLREDENLILARLVIDQHTFTYGGVLGHSDDFVLFASEENLPNEAQGVQVYFLFVESV